MARGDTSSRKPFEIIDLGFRLDDVRAFGLGDRDEEAFDRGSVGKRGQKPCAATARPRKRSSSCSAAALNSTR